MIDIQQQYSLRHHNTFGFDQRAENFVAVQDDESLVEALDYAKEHALDVFVLGGGSNLVLTKDINGLVIHCAQQHLEYQTLDSEHNGKVTVGAGVQWHSLVLDTLAQGLAGLENLSLIPGQVGAAPVQNIGAYGVELKDRLHSLRALHLPSRQWREFSADECEFDYRHSIFKRCRNEYLITEVTFTLGDCHGLNTAYDSLARYLDEQQLSNPTARDISQAVMTIRRSRLPDYQQLGNAGSFFHNPIVTKVQVASLRQQYPEMPAFEVSPASAKLSAAWMIDTLGYRGVRRGDVGIYEKQALVLVNHVAGSSQGRSLIALAEEIRTEVETHFNVSLSMEPVVI